MVLEMSALIASVYGVVAGLIFLRQLLDTTSYDFCGRAIVFWPLYVFRWFVTNAILALKGK
jgi:hypothetical protein